LGGAVLLLSAYNRYDSGTSNSFLFEAIYYAAYILGGIANIAAGILYEKIPDDKKETVGKWLQIVIAVLLLFDAVDKIIKGKIAMPAALIFASALYFLAAIFSSKFKGRRVITIDGDRISFRKSIFKTKTIMREKIKDISFTQEKTKILLKLNNGKTFALFPAKNDEDILNAFSEKLNELKNRLNKNNPA
jgi:hypothetical protein